MLTNQQRLMLDRAVIEIEEQTTQLDSVHAKYEHLVETPAFEKVTEAILMHNAHLDNFVNLLKSPNNIHVAVWEHTMESMAHAYDKVLTAYGSLDANQGKSDFAKTVESKQEHTEAKPEKVEEAPAPKPESEKVEAPKVESEPEKVEEEAKVEAKEPEKHTVDMNAQCSRVESLTEGQCHTLNEAMQKAQDCGMRVVDDKPADSE